jgi:hypothetical protein
MKAPFGSCKTWIRAEISRSIILLVLLWLPSPWMHGDSDTDIMATVPHTTLFLPGLVSNDLNNRDLTISADGDELYTSIVSPGNRHSTIVVSRKLPDDNWSALEVASFSGQYSDLEPALSTDGNTLYFASRRPIEGTAEKDWDIWKTTRSSGTWTTPVNLGEPINSSGDEFYPSVSRTGSLYFTASLEGGMGKEDLYRSSFESGRYQPPINLGNKINSPAYEFNGYIDPDENFLVFGSAGRSDSLGSGDLYISFRNAEGNFEDAIHLPAPINSSNLDYCPFVSRDKEYLYFTSDRDTLKMNLQANYNYLDLARQLRSFGNGSGDIYRIPLGAVIKMAHEGQLSR